MVFVAIVCGAVVLAVPIAFNYGYWKGKDHGMREGRAYQRELDKAYQERYLDIP